MFSFLKNHPFAVEAFFESSLVLTFALPKHKLYPLIPPCVELDSFNEQWAFLAVAMVQTKGLRPKGFPQIFGNDFFLIGYRVFVRYTDTRGKKLRGLYILKSETDSKKMELMGNIFTQYNYSTTDISHSQQGNTSMIASDRSDFKVVFDLRENDIGLPAHSPFANWKEARRFCGPLPFTFTYQPEKKQVLIIEGVRQKWIPRPVHIIDHRFSFLNGLGLPEAVLASAFMITDIPYFWKKGRTEKWSQ